MATIEKPFEKVEDKKEHPKPAVEAEPKNSPEKSINY